MRTIVKRFFTSLGILAAVIWLAAPAVAAWPKASHPAGEDTSCGCCDSGSAIIGGLGCVGCQAAPAQLSAAADPRAMTVLSWSADPAAAVVGIDLAPADPPPRLLSVN